METTIAVTTTDLVQVINNQSVTTSRKVAEYFERNHRDVVKSILTLKENLEKSTLKRPANFYADQMFMETSYVDEQNRTYTEYLMNRDGFSLLVMGFNNTEKVLEYKLKFIDAFNRMEEELNLLNKDKITQALTISGDRANAAANHLGIELGMARIHAMNEVEDELGVNLESWKRFLPPSTEMDIPSLIPTDLSKLLKEEFNQPISAQKVNSLLCKGGYQTKPIKDWLLTDKGKAFASIVPFDNKKTGHAGYQIKWKETIMPILKQLLSENTTK